MKVQESSLDVSSKPPSKKMKFEPKLSLKEERELIEIEDSRNYNMLMLAIEENDENLANTLADLDFDLAQLGEDNKRAVDLAVEKEMFEVFVKLIEADSPFPGNFGNVKIPKESNAFKKLRDLIKKRKKFHWFVKTGELEILKIEVARNFRLKSAYDILNKSALTYAIEHKQFEVFAFLQSQGFSKGVDPFYLRTFENLSGVEKNSIATFNLRYFQCAGPNPHINSLISKTKIASRAPKRSKFYEEILKFYNDLDAIPGVSEVLQVVALSESLIISFDFENSSVQKMHPAQPTNSSGVFFEGGYIYIAAGEWQSARNEVLGVIAHEFTHCAMKKIYKNQTLPYHAVDTERREEFVQVVESTGTVLRYEDDREEIISLVYDCYGPKQREAELIVRVPYLLAKYKDDVDKIEHLKLTFVDLFKFYETKTLPDLLRHFEDAEFAEKVKTLNDEAGLLKLIRNDKIEFRTTQADQCFEETNDDKIKILVSNSTIHSMAAIIKQLEEQENVHVTIGLKFLMEQFNRIRQLIESNQKLFLIINCADQFDGRQKTIVEVILSLKHHKIFLVVDDDSEEQKTLKEFDENNSKTFHLEHKWKDLTPNYRKRLLQKVIKFHGNSFPLGVLLGNFDSSALECLPLNEFVGQNQLTVCASIIKSSKFYLSRRFSFRSKDSESYLSVDDVTDWRKTIAVISGIAGSGKSTALQKIAEKLQKKSPDNWVSFVDLKQHLDVFQNEPSRSSFATFASKLTSVRSENEKFERKLFKNFYDAGKVLLLLDGFDEISPAYKQSVSEYLLKFQPKQGNQLWITTRTHLQSHLEELLGVSALEILPFDEDEQTEFLVKYWENDPKDSKSNQLLEPQSRSIVKGQNECTGDLSNSIRIPLLMEILASSCRKKVCGGNALELTKTFDLYSLYEEYFDRMIETWRYDKGQLSKEEQKRIDKSGNAVLVVHQKLAMKLLFSHEELEELRISIEYDEKVWTKAALMRVGLVSFSDKSTVGAEFLHQTFAEFFVAQFVVLNLKSENQSQALKVFFKIIDNHEVNQCLKFTLVEEGTTNLSVEEMTDDVLKYFHKIAPPNRKNRIKAQQVHNSYENIIQIWSRHDSGKLFKEVVSVLRETLTSEKIEELLKDTVDDNCDHLISLLKVLREVVDPFLSLG